MVTKAAQGTGAEIELFMHVLNVIIWVVASFGIPYVLARQGVRIGQNIVNRMKTNQTSTAPDIVDPGS